MTILQISSISDFVKLAKAISVDSRAQIFELLTKERLNINEIATRLAMPVSSVTLNIKKLEEVGLVESNMIPGERGLQKMCSVPFDQLNYSTSPPPSSQPTIERLRYSQKLGVFKSCSVKPTCGLASSHKIIGKKNSQDSFLLPERSEAELIWFCDGWIEYIFPLETHELKEILKVDFSAEICSEAFCYKNDYPSDITLWINEVEIGTWTSPGDFGRKRGKLTPKWWPSYMSQYGILKHWVITAKGAYIDKAKVSAINIADLKISDHGGLRIRLGIKPNAVNSGGINIFGSRFGHYPQDLELELEVQRKEQFVKY